ncbi:MAG: RnfABCDGE type electron transport complex subunit G [Clostridia bacterium]|nr:RnfABCDGE type electron transport complex subunit G [Clostridia bacterium]
MKSKFPVWARLTVITLVAGLMLGAVYALTKDAIDEQARLAQEASRRAVFETAESFNPVELEENAPVDSLYEAIAGNEVAGYVCAITVKGYGGNIEVTVGMTPDGTVSGIAVGGADFSETAGLGAKTKEPDFTSQFKGLVLPIAVTKDGGQVDSVTSATISSRAITNGVAEAIEYMLTEVSE